MENNQTNSTNNTSPEQSKNSVPNNTEQTVPKKKNKVFPIVLGAILLIVGYIIVTKIMFALKYEDTENAQVECNISPITPRISGFVTSLKVKDNQFVHKGDTLLTIDQRDLVIRVKQAEIALENAKANLELIQSNVGTASASSFVSNENIATAKANVEVAKIRLSKSNTDYKRYEDLLKSGSISIQQFDNVKADKENSEKLLEVAQKQFEATKAQSSVSGAQLGSSEKQIKVAKLTIDQRKTEYDFAKLQLSFATMVSPCDGNVSKKNVQLGQLVNVGQSLFSIVDENLIWVNANFKETQIEKMKVGQSVQIKADAFSDKKFEGKVESVASATGAKFSLLPTDNATGNFVKVVQRIPVRVSLTNNPDSKMLRAGMNVKVIVEVN